MGLCGLTERRLVVLKKISSRQEREMAEKIRDISDLIEMDAEEICNMKTDCSCPGGIDYSKDHVQSTPVNQMEMYAVRLDAKERRMVSKQNKLCYYLCYFRSMWPDDYYIVMEYKNMLPRRVVGYYEL